MPQAPATDEERRIREAYDRCVAFSAARSLAHFALPFSRLANPILFLQSPATSGCPERDSWKIPRTHDAGGASRRLEGNRVFTPILQMAAHMQ